MIKAKLETCPVCGSTKHENLVRIEKGGIIKVYVRCANCSSFVARYRVIRYTSDKSYDSLLRIFKLSPGCPDCRSIIHEVEAFSEEVKREFEETVRIVEERPEKKKIEEMIKEET
ncbi:hypothetical protein DRQ16_03055 [bacterium]|nr:MAG: hypothetical protein DRQ16_03055 [bacterium]